MGIPVNFVFIAQSDQVLQWGPVATGLTANDPTPTYVDDATGSFTLYDPNGVAVPGATAVAFAYVGSSTGIYRGTILGSGFNPPLGTGYTLVVSLTSVTQGARQWTEAAEVALSVAQ